MFVTFGLNILSFVWISTLLLFYVEGYFSLSFYLIDFKPWHDDPWVLGRCSMTFLSHRSCLSGFIQNFLKHYVDQCWFNVVNVGRNPHE